MRHFQALIAIVLLALLAACGGGADAPAGGERPAGVAIVGTEGGQGAGEDGARVTLSAAAPAEPLQIFALPAEVRLPFDATAVAADTRVALAKAEPAGPGNWPIAPLPPADSVAEYRLVALDATLASQPLAGEGGRVYLQPTLARPQFRIDVNLPATGGLERVCPSGLATLNVSAGPGRCR